MPSFFGGVRGGLDVVERIVHGDHERLALDALGLQGQEIRLDAILHGDDVPQHGRAVGMAQGDRGVAARRRTRPAAGRSSAPTRRARRTASPATVRCVRMSSSAWIHDMRRTTVGTPAWWKYCWNMVSSMTFDSGVVARIGDHRHVFADRHAAAG